MPRDTLDALIADLAGMPTDLRRELRPALISAAQPILQDARRRASWSTRIPGAITLKASFSTRSPGVRLFVDARKARHARPYEFASARNRRLRVPVFGRGWWSEREPRRFFFPAVRAGEAGVVRSATVAVQAAARSAGFR